MEIILGMLFLSFSNIDIQFEAKKFTWRLYIAAEALPTTNGVELIDKREFTKAALDKNTKTFVMHMSVLDIESSIHPSQATQIVALQWDKASTKVPFEYANYADIFSFDLAMELPESTGINEYAIELVEEKQPPYRPIHAFSLVELETLKTYIETHLKTGFIRLSKCFADAPIFFEKKPDGSLCLYINY